MLPSLTRRFCATRTRRVPADLPRPSRLDGTSDCADATLGRAMPPLPPPGKEITPDGGDLFRSQQRSRFRQVTKEAGEDER
jgi:hypothetical protein